MKPRFYKLLDLFCGAGLAAIGYRQAGFQITGVDIERKSTYTGHSFLEADAIEILQDVDFCRRLDAIHASPPCQLYSRSTAVHRFNGKEYPDYISIVRQHLQHIGKPYVIRKRHFELGNGFFMMQPIDNRNNIEFVTIIGKGSYRNSSNYPPGWRPSFDKRIFELCP